MSKHGLWGTPFYYIWQNMKARCINKNSKAYKYYGDRGITYDLKWENFLGFKEDMYFKYIYAKKEYKNNRLTLEREDTNQGYNFKNCSFIPKSQQNKNKRNTTKKFKAISPNGRYYISKSQIDFAKSFNIARSNISRCLNGIRKQTKGWRFNYVNL